MSVGVDLNKHASDELEAIILLPLLTIYVELGLFRHDGPYFQRR